ncbi:hypothetical protein AG1IA_04127 [Rhizoctonia solani AG-1 IA]|uniref:Uncharacterized protein n=1 Tax=Thanatephorus cucumeris (strain AG1-IA) TaxID=983506 RepID=L8WYD1_THACA|nr:hypothetical protein AG1IA_04127 [Rhizoctonia solani AG-1 IA]
MIMMPEPTPARCAIPDRIMPCPNRADLRLDPPQMNIDGIPDASARLQILSVLLRDTPHELTGPELESLGPGRSNARWRPDRSCPLRSARPTSPTRC